MCFEPSATTLEQILAETAIEKRFRPGGIPLNEFWVEQVYPEVDGGEFRFLCGGLSEMK
jgi:hypothetical protein